VIVAGPGGHSSGKYGNTSAVHAASRAIMQIHAAVPDATVVDFKGGSTVNAIAADATFKVRLSGPVEKQQKDAELVKMAVSKGCAEENAFRNVKEGELEIGLRKDIRCTIK
ncbi:MAG: peptidase dimerization domain-containing protein, partial [Burkholderiales bacterium]|nr:peptidase dimerization domain-containing protein [Burkholderiales bacterium]